MKCGECGKEINSNTKYCKYCGAPIQSSMQQFKSIQQIPPTIQCPNCGTEVKANNIYCTKCGTSLSVIPIKKNKISKKFPKSSSKNKENTIIKIIKIIVITLSISITLFIILLVFYFFNENDLFSQSSTTRVEREETIGEVPNKDELLDDSLTSDPILNKNDNQTNQDSAENKDDAILEIQNNMEDNNSDTINTINVEETVNVIREQYNDIATAMASGKYTTTFIDTSTAAYYEGTVLKAVTFTDEINDIAYKQYFYYDKNILIFVYLEGTDSHRLYFKNDKLVRWRYCADASDNQNAINYDFESTSQYYNWESSILDKSKQLYTAWQNSLTNENTIQNNINNVNTPQNNNANNVNQSQNNNVTTPQNNANNQYILNGSDSRYISKSELQGLDANQCRLARNEIYARHGRKFNDQYLQNYFNSKIWYTPRIEPDNFSESVLNTYERANRDLIVAYENERGYR